jgi:CRISPR/Cas system-associated exonuclease Cas4 (RecB family)
MKSDYDTYDLWAHLDAHVTRPKFKPEVDRSHLWPSEASVQFYDQHGDLTTEGKCMRAAYFRSVGDFEEMPYPAYTEWIFKFGKLAEKMIVNEAKEAGIWVQNNVKFYNKEYNISGEIDTLFAEPPDGVIYPSEIKTGYGYFAEKEIMGNYKQPGQPKLGHLLQLLVYLWEFKEQFPYGRMIYFLRDSMKRRTFKVELEQQGDIFYPVVEGKVNKLFTVNDILSRYKELQHHIDNKIVPPQEFELQYSDRKIRDFAVKGKIGKTKFGKWEKGKLKTWEYMGDWPCRLCAYRNICYENVVDEPDKNSL